MASFTAATSLEPSNVACLQKKGDRFLRKFTLEPAVIMRHRAPLGPLNTAKGGFTHLLVAVDKFTKWIEVKPIIKQDGQTAVSFIKGLIYLFGISHIIITDNGKNFTFRRFSLLLRRHGLRLDYGSVAHPQCNGQVEHSNGLILQGIKPRLLRPLKETLSCWLDELPPVLLELMDDSKQINRLHAFLYGLWSRSRHAE